MVELEIHKKLVDYAKDFLKSLNFKEKEIFLEYRIYRKPESYSSMSYYVDIVGKSIDSFIMIECGDVSPEKINFLLTKGKVFVLPYDSKIPKEVTQKMNKKEKMEIMSISVRKDQKEFIKKSRRTFVFSKFIRDKLDEYIEDITNLNMNHLVVNSERKLIEQLQKEVKTYEKTTNN